MALERFLKKTDGLESDEPIGEGRVPPTEGGGDGSGIPPIDAGKSPGFGVGNFGPTVSVTPTMPNVAGLKALISALRRRESAAEIGDETAVAQASEAARAALREIAAAIGPESAS